MLGFWPLVKVAANAGILSGGYPYSRNFLYVGDNMPAFATSRYSTVAAALAAMIEGDVLLLGPQTYDEGDLTIDVDDITIIGTGNRGECSITPSAAASNGINILSSGVTLNNVDVGQGAAGSYAVKVGNISTQTNRFTAIDCKFEGHGIALHLQEAGDVRLIKCEFAWATIGLRLQSGDDGFCTEILVDDCLFHDIVTDHIGQSANQQEVDGLWVRNCVHGLSEGGTAPTKFINLANAANIGMFTRNSYAIATNSNTKLVIGAGLLWVTNYTEAGSSTARPA
jgi:hypothetical protein